MTTRNKAKKIVENYLGVYDKRTLTENEKGILVSVENMVVDLLEGNYRRPVKKLECTQCGQVFNKKSKKHFKCPRCGAHFTKPTNKKVTQ